MCAHSPPFVGHGGVLPLSFFRICGCCWVKARNLIIYLSIFPSLKIQEGKRNQKERKAVLYSIASFVLRVCGVCVCVVCMGLLSEALWVSQGTLIVIRVGSPSFVLSYCPR